jgi:hypothetical protein
MQDSNKKNIVSTQVGHAIDKKQGSYMQKERQEEGNKPVKEKRGKRQKTETEARKKT